MKWFKEKEFACKCCGQLPPLARENVKALVTEVLDPVREKLTTSTSVATRQSSSKLGSALAAPSVGVPIVVNSGYCCEKHNKDVGGVRNSQHLKGEAADIHCEDNEKLKQLIIENGKFDQLITYPTFLHVSYKRTGGNRHQRLKKGGAGYELD